MLSYRFKMSIILPKEHFVCCIGCYVYDDKTRIYVKDEWLAYIHARSFSVFVKGDGFNQLLLFKRYRYATILFRHFNR